MEQKTRQKLLVILCYLLLWQVIAMIVNNPLILASPIETVQAMGMLIVSTQFWKIVGTTLIHLFCGFLLAVLVGMTFAYLSYHLPLLKLFLEPLMKLFQTVPVACVIILLLIWMGSSMISPFIAFMVGLPILYTNTLSALERTDQKMIEMAQVFGIKWWRKVKYIFFLPAKETMANTFCLAAGMCLRAGIAGEVIGVVKNTIGEQIYLSKIYLNTDQLFAWTIWILLLSYGFEKMIRRVCYGKRHHSKKSGFAIFTGNVGK